MSMGMTMRTVRGHVVIAISGTADHYVSGRLLEHLTQAINETGWRGRMIVDLTALEQVDSAGIKALVAAYWRAVDLDSWFCLVAPHFCVRHMLPATEIGSVPVYPAIDLAMAGAPRTPGVH